MEVPVSGTGVRTCKGKRTVGDGLVPSRVDDTALADPGDRAPAAAPDETGSTQADDWSRTTPLAVFFFLGRTIRSLVSSVVNLAASAAGIAILVKQHVLLAAAAVALGLVALVVVAGLRYWFFRFRVGKHGVLIRQGVLKKTQLDLRFDRIQGISTEQSLLYRVLGLVTVRFTTAGAAGDEGHLPAVTPEFVARLRDRLDAKPRQREESGSEAEILLRLDRSEVTRIGLTDPRVLQFALLGTALMPAFDPAVVGPVGKAVEEAYKRAADLATRSLAVLADLGPLLGVLTVVLLFLGIALVFLVGSVGVALLRYHGYELRQEGSAFRASSGLLTRKDVIVEVAKVQQLTVRQGPVMGWMQRHRVQALPASGGPAVGEMPDDAQKLVVPIAGARIVESLRERVFGSEGLGVSVLPRDNRFAPVSAYAIWPPVLWLGVVPAVVSSILVTGVFGTVGLSCLGWILVVAPMAWQRWRRHGYFHDDDALVCRSGFLGFRVEALLFRKVQQACVSQSPLQRRKDLATLRVHLATGNVTLAFIDHATARRLRDYVLYKAASSRLAWH